MPGRLLLRADGPRRVSVPTARAGNVTALPFGSGRAAPADPSRHDQAAPSPHHQAGDRRLRDRRPLLALPAAPAAVAASKTDSDTATTTVAKDPKTGGIGRKIG